MFISCFKKAPRYLLMLPLLYNRWLHSLCDQIEDEEQAERCAEYGYNCPHCRPPDELPPHLLRESIFPFLLFVNLTHLHLSFLSVHHFFILQPYLEHPLRKLKWCPKSHPPQWSPRNWVRLCFHTLLNVVIEHLSLPHFNAMPFPFFVVVCMLAEWVGIELYLMQFYVTQIYI